MFNAENFFKKFFSIIAALVITGLVVIIGIAIHQRVRSNGEISYCYTTTYYGQYDIKKVELHGYREWREDRLIGAYDTDDEAIDMANKINCRIGTKR